MNRFDYVKYDEESAKLQAAFKEGFTQLEKAISCLADGRPKSIVMTKLEEAYMWVGKAIRDGQFQRNGSVQVQEERKNG